MPDTPLKDGRQLVIAHEEPVLDGIDATVDGAIDADITRGVREGLAIK